MERRGPPASRHVERREVGGGAGGVAGLWVAFSSHLIIAFSQSMMVSPLAGRVVRELFGEHVRLTLTQIEIREHVEGMEGGVCVWGGG